jgi:hypothetical protein
MGDLVFWGRKYGDYNLSSHGNQRIQADAWGVNPGVGWYVTTPNPFSPNGRQIQAAGPIYNTEGEAKPASTQSSWMARIRRPLRHPVHRLALLISLERYATPLPFFSLWPQRGADGAAPSKGYSRLELASCRLSRPSGRAKFLKLTGLVVDSVHSDPKSKSFATRRIFLQAARDHEDDHHTHPKKLGRDFD